MEVIIKYKKIIVITLVVLLIGLIVWQLTKENLSNSSPEKVAKSYIESILQGDAEKAVSYMSKYTVSESLYETKKLLINALEKKLNQSIDSYKDKYGSNWEYEIVVIDSVEYSVDEYKETCNHYGFERIMMVYLEVKHTGGLFFTRKEESEEFEVLLAREDGKWVVISW